MDDVFIYRPNWDDVFMEITETLSKRSTCARLHTAAILVRDKRIISVGYNGVASGAKHCIKHWIDYYSEHWRGVYSFEEFIKLDLFYDLHHEWSLNNEMHGEQNAILYAGKTGISTDKTTMYTLYSPCINCAKVILTAGLQHVIYKNEYSRDLSGIEFLRVNNVKITKLICGFKQ